MRILAFSDVHGNVSVVRRLRAQEPDRFDLVVVAGDVGFIGGDHAGEVLATLATFGCPVLYVLGNHDSRVIARFREDSGVDGGVGLDSASGR